MKFSFFKYLFLLILVLSMFNGFGQDFGPQQIISTSAGSAESVYAADLDGDGDADVLSASSSDNKIAWYENLGGSFGPQQIITLDAAYAIDVYATDIDGDGDADVLSASRDDNKIAWYENLGGSFGPQQIITTLAEGALSIHVDDLNGDGNIDVLSTSLDDDKTSWYENLGASFSAQQIVSTSLNGPADVYAADLDGDNDIDVLSAGRFNFRIVWYENLGGSFGGQQTIVSDPNTGYSSVFSADLDGDNDNDVLSTSIIRDEVAWFENTGGNFSVKQVISALADDARSVYAEDLDGDGDIDVLSASSRDDKIAWYENLGGSFGEQKIITTNADFASDVFSIDLDGDGDADVLSASRNDNKIAWYENLIEFNINTSIVSRPCLNVSNGIIQIQTYGPRKAPFTYYWEHSGNGSNGSGVSSSDVFTIDGLAGGFYNILVVDANGDSATVDDFELSTILGSYFEIVELNSINSSNGLNNGSIEVSIAGGSPSYTYAWSGPSVGNQTTAANTFTISNISAGDYTITVTENGGSQSQYTVTLLDETIPQETCQDGLDIVILNDVSGSVDGTEYSESKQFFVDFMNALNVGTSINNANVAVVEWSSTGEQTTKIPLTGSLPTLQNYNNHSRAYGGGTNPNNALTFGRNYLANNGRNGVSKVIVLSTDAAQSQVSGSLIALANQYKAQGYFIVTIAFDDAYSDGFTRNILRQAASSDGVVYGAPAYSQLNNDIAETIVNLYVCPVDPGSSNTVFFNRDGVIDIIGYSENGFCPNPESVEIELTITAQQQLSLPPGTPITFYYNNPELFGANQIITYNIPCAIPAGTSENITVILPISNPANVYAVLNDDGSQPPPIDFSITVIDEYVYINNIDNISICTDPLPTISALKYTTTPIPICDSIVIYNVDVCNISSADANGVEVTDIPPNGAVLQSSNVNYNGCSSGSSPYNIPAGCCVSITYTYDISNVANGFYNDQDVELSGPGGQTYINFDGAPTVMEDVEIDGNIDCVSDVVTFSKEVNVTEICEESFVTFTFTIDNQTNIDIFNVDFTDNLPNPIIWAAEPYLMDGVSIGQSNITGNANANFTIDIIEANTTATFYMDAYLGDWTNNGVVTNIATIENWPSFVNGNGVALTATAPSVNVYVLPTVDAENLVQINSDEVANLQAIISDGINPEWVTDGDGTFVDANVEDAVYIPGMQDIEKGIVNFTISAESPLPECGEALDTVLLEITKVYDFGDAPNSYNTLSASNGAQHFLTYTNKQALFLGSNNSDNETDGQPVTLGQVAMNDDNIEQDDEDGILSFPPLYNDLVGNYTVQIQAQNLLVENATIIGWVDFNKDQQWTANESAAINIPQNSNLQNYNVSFNLPAILDTGITYARFRITTDNLIDNSTTSIDERSTGLANDGEVEDYEVYIIAREICDNGIDDDGDGDIDTADVDCQTCKALFTAGNSCLGEVSVLDASIALASPQANVTSYYWDFGDGNTGGQLIEQHAYNTTGDYDVLLVVEDDSSCIDSLIQTVTIHEIPNVQFNSEGPFCLNEGQIVLRGGSPDGGIYSGNGMTNDSIFDPSIAGIGNQTVQYTYIDVNGCTDSVTTNITVNDIPTVNLSPISDLCETEAAITLSTGSPMGGTYEGIGVVGNTFDPSIAGVGSFEISYTYEENGCSDTASQEIDVNPIPTVTLNNVPDVCILGGSITLTQGSPAGGVYEGLGINGDSFDPTITGVGSHNISYRFEDSLGCSDTSYATILVYDISGIGIAPINNVCFNEVSFVLTQGMPIGGVYVGNGVVNDSIFNPQDAGIGTHIIQYIFDDGNGCADTAETTITVDAIPDVRFDPINDRCLVDGIIALSGAHPSGGNFEGLGVIGNNFDPNISGTGTFSIDYIYVDNNNCTDTASQFITVLDTELDTIKAVICEGESYTLSNGQNVTAAGFYTDSMLNVGTCGLIEVTSLSIQDHSIDTIQSTLCGGSSYVLSDGTTVTQPGTYVDSLRSINDCDSTIITVLTLDESGCLDECFLTAPSAFTPDGDNVNDVFYILTTCNELFTAFEFTIYNRWGEAVFTSNSISNGWDGKAFGLEAEMDVYTFVVNYNRERVGVNEVFSGVIALIR